MPIQARARLSAILALAAMALLNSCSQIGSGGDVSTTRDASGSYTGSIRVSLAHPADATSSNYQLMFAASRTATALGVCVLSSSSVTTPPASCQVNGPGYVSIAPLANTSAHNYFLAQKAYLEDGLTLMIVTSDATGTVNDSRTVIFNSVAGATTSGTTAPATATSPLGT